MNSPINSASVTQLRVIVVEDNLELLDILVTGLRHFGHHALGVGNGQELDKVMEESQVDIVVLDLGLPGEDGIAIAKRLRKNCDCGIVMVTARGEQEQRVLGREIGADLYFVKPVHIQELNAAMINLANRLLKKTKTIWHFSALTSTLITPQGVEIPLTAQECILMQKLLEAPGTTVSRGEIFRMLHQPNDIYADKRLEALVSRLRGKVRSADAGCKLPVHARHNLGYAFLAEAEPAITNRSSL
jgi:DNA-binding response OmpR family regulator